MPQIMFASMNCDRDADRPLREKEELSTARWIEYPYGVTQIVLQDNWHTSIDNDSNPYRV